MSKQTILTISLSIALFSTLFAQNLIKNGDCELPIVNGKIPDWTEVQGNEWRPYNLDATPQSGQFYFFAGAPRNAELMQDVDVSNYTCAIDVSLQRFNFVGYARSFAQNPPDQARIILEYRNANNTILSAYDSGNQTPTTAWLALTDLRLAPVGTRKIRIRLVSTLRAGTDNDGIYDNLSLTPNPARLSIDIIKTKPTACASQANGEIHFSASGGTPPYRYVLTDFTPEIIYYDSIIKNLSNGTYNVSVRDNNGCSVSSRAVVPYTTELSFALEGKKSDEICGRKNGAIKITAIGGKGSYMFKLNNGPFQTQNSFDSLQGGISFNITIKDSAGCVHSQNIPAFVVRSIPGPSIDSINITPTNCNKDNGKIEVIARIGGAPIQFSLDSIQYVSTFVFSNLKDSSYRVFVRDTNKCITSKNVVVPRLALPKFDSVTVKPSTCAKDNGSISVVAKNVMFSLDSILFNSTRQFPNLKSGNYTIYIRDSGNCVISQKTAVQKILPPTINDIQIQPESCQKKDGQIVVKANSQASTLWFSLDSAFTRRDSFLNLNSGIFIVSVKDSFNCIVKQNVTVQNQPVPLIEEVKTTPSVCGGATGIILIKAKAGSPMSYSIDSTNFQADYLFRSVKAGKYNVVVKDKKNCQTIVQAEVTRDCGLFIPTAFSPNEDGNNDYFCFFGDASKVDKVLDFKVFNRWGILVFNDNSIQINNETTGWDGKFKGKDLDIGIYIYYLKVQLKDGTAIEEKGGVTLLR